MDELELLKKLIEQEFDNTLGTAFFHNKDTNTLVGTIYKGLQQQKQELCKSIFDQLSPVIKTLPYPPLTSDQTEAMGVLRQGIRGLTKIDELVFRSMELTASRILKNGNSIIG